MFSCATPNQLYLFVSVWNFPFPAQISFRVLGGTPYNRLLNSVCCMSRNCWLKHPTHCPNRGGLLLKQLLQFQGWQVFSQFLGWERENNNLNPGNALSWTWQFISMTEPQIIFSDTAYIHITSMYGPIQGLSSLRFPIRSGSKARFVVQWKFEGAFQIWFQSKSNLSEIFSGILLNWKFPKPFSCSVIITAKMSIDFTKQW